ncbi:MAG TPA: hypothetical protein VIT21_01355 [Chthoniobacterales bacterium]
MATPRDQILARIALWRRGQFEDDFTKVIVAEARADAAIAEKLRAQIEIDAGAENLLQTMAVDDAVIERLKEEGVRLAKTRKRQSQFRLFSPIGFTVIFAVLVMSSVVAWTVIDRTQYENQPITAMLLDQATNVSEQTMESVDVSAGDLTDWVFLKHGLEDVQIPDAIARKQAAFCGLTRIDGHPVVKIALKESKALVFLFKASDFSLPESEKNAWEIFDRGEWAAGIQVDKGNACMVTVNGSVDDVRRVVGAK